jgi:putative transposase
MDLFLFVCPTGHLQPICLRLDGEQLTIHSDRGGPMISKSHLLLLSDLGVTKSHARPHVPNNNPYSEAQYKTMKYRPDYPDRFGALQDARTWARPFFSWYNFQHHHTGLGLMTPAQVHNGLAPTFSKPVSRRYSLLTRLTRNAFLEGCPRRRPCPTPSGLINPRHTTQLTKNFLNFRGYVSHFT